jgi:uncharacterized protein YdeI (YjbR/CyaY-like superfamily)
MKSELFYLNRENWRSWLEKNHEASKEIWLIYYKKHTEKIGIAYEASVEEALCFGWVDSIIKRLDDNRCARKFTPRRDTSVWSESNKKRAEKMIREGKMSEVGMAKIREARERGEWLRIREVSKELVVPFYIQNALEKNKEAHVFWATLADSHKRLMVRWVSSAKKGETKDRRLREVIGLLEKRQKLGMK